MYIHTFLFQLILKMCIVWLIKSMVLFVMHHILCFGILKLLT